MDPLDIINTSGADIVCVNQGVTVTGDGTPYSVPAANAVAWAKDPFVLSNMLQNNLQVSTYGLVFSGGSAFDWMNFIANGTVVYY